MDKETAIKVFEELATLAQKNGILGLQDVPTILTAIDFLKNENTDPVPNNLD